MSSLKPCPMCAGTDIDAADNEKPVYCKGCGLRAITPAAWNARAPIPVTDEMVERAAVAIVESTDGPWDYFNDYGQDAARVQARAALTEALGDGK